MRPARSPSVPDPPASLPNSEPPIGAVSGRFAASAADAREGTFCALVRRICRPVKLIVCGSAPCRPHHGSQRRGYRTMFSATRRLPPLCLTPPHPPVTHATTLLPPPHPPTTP